MKNKFTGIISMVMLAFLSVTLFQSCKPQKIVSLKSLLNEMTDRKSLSLYPSPWYKLKQAGSYDRNLTQPEEKDGLPMTILHSFSA